MATHGRTGPGRWVLGSVAEAVVAASPVPVLVQRAWQPLFGESLLNDRPKVIVPLDASAFAETALEAAASMEPPPQAPLRLALGLGALASVGMLLFATYYDQVGLTLGQIWLLVVGVPVVVGTVIVGWSWLTRRRLGAAARFDPTSED